MRRHEGAPSGSTVLAAAVAAVGLTGCGADGVRGSVRIEPEPSDRAFVTLVSEDVGTEALTFSSRVGLGLGSGYAPQVEVRLQGFAAEDSPCWFVGSVTLESVEGNELVDAHLIGDGDALSLTPSHGGRTTLVAHGRYVIGSSDPACGFEPEEELPAVVELDLTVTDNPAVAIVRGASCSDGLDHALAMAGGTLWSVEATALDDGGEPIEMLNASALRQVPLTIHGIDVDSLDEVRSLEWLPIPASGRVEIAPDRGESMFVEVVPARDVHEASVDLHGPVADGEVGQLEPFDVRDVVFGVSMLHHDGVLLCSTADPEAFVVTPTTPSTCGLGPRDERPVKKGVKGTPLADWLEIQSSGYCEVEVSLPPSGGFQERFGFTALSVEDVE